MNTEARPTNVFVIGYFAVLAIATFAAYSSIGGSTVLRWDDNVYLHSELVQSLDLDNLLAILYTQHHSNWHPLTTLSFAIENAIWGQNAVYAKITNICLHLIVSFLFYRLGFELLLLATREPPSANAPGLTGIFFEDRQRFALLASLFAATLFALHPQHVESVAWVSERKGLLCAVFYLSALISYLRISEAKDNHYQSLTVVFMLLALMSKPMAVSLPVAMILLDIYPLKRVTRLTISLETIRTLLHGKAIFILLSIASVIITLLYQDPQGKAIFAYLPRLINACMAYLHYLTSIFYPLDLSPFYPFVDTSLEPSASSLIPVTAFIGAVIVSIVLYRRKIRFPLVILSFYVISLLPVIGIVKVGRQSMADRYAYLPTIWFYLLLGVAVFALLASCKKSFQRYMVGLCFIAVCAWLGVTTHDHTRHWRDDVVMWERVVDLYPRSASIAYINLASAHDARGDMSIDEIERLILKAIELSPDNPYNLGAAANFYGQLGQEDKALEYLLDMIEAAPYNYWARAQAGDIYFNRNDFPSAGNHYLAALQLGSDSQEVIFRLAWIEFQFQRYADALAKLALVTAPRLADKKRALMAQLEQAMAQSAEPAE